MNTKKQADFQPDIYKVALSLDSLLVNGIQYGVMVSMSPNSFVQKLGESLLKDLVNLRQAFDLLPVDKQQKANALHGEMHAGFLGLIDLLERLVSFRSFSLQELHATVSQLSPYRIKSVRLIEELEKCLPVSKPFYSTRPKDAAAAVEGFLADLEQNFEEAWKASRSTTRAPIA